LVASKYENAGHVTHARIVDFLTSTRDAA